MECNFDFSTPCAYTIHEGARLESTDFIQKHPEKGEGAAVQARFQTASEGFVATIRFIWWGVLQAALTGIHPKVPAPAPT